LKIQGSRIHRKSLAMLALTVILFSSMFSVNVFAGSLGSVQFSPTTDLVNSVSLYTIRFSTATTATINQVLITFPSGFGLGSAKLVTETGLPVATKITIAGQVINYSFTAKSISSTTNVFFIFQGIKNPLAAGSFSLTATVQTKNGATLVDSGSSVAFSIRQLTGADISTSSSLTIAALSTGTLTVTGAATFKSTVTSTGLLTANGGIFIPSGQELQIGGSLSGLPGLAVGNGLFVNSTGFVSEHGFDNYGASCISSYFHLLHFSCFFGADASGDVFFSGSLAGAGSQFFVESNGIVCEGFGSTPCGGTVEVDPAGSLYAAGGSFAVGTNGQINTQSVGFQSLDGYALPDGWDSTTGTVATSPSFAPGRFANAMVFVTVDVQSFTGSAGEISVTLQTSGYTGITILPESVHGFYIAGNSEQSVTYEFLVTGFTPSTAAGTFSSLVASCAVGPACGGSGISSSYSIYDNMVNVVWLPA